MVRGLFAAIVWLMACIPALAQNKANPDSIPFFPVANYGTGVGPTSVFCADLNGDGKLDLAVANALSNSVSVLLNNSNGTFQSAVNWSAGNYPYSIFCADLDGDGDKDIAVANLSSNDVSILKNNGDGTFQAAVNYGAGIRPTSIFCCDLDRDGDMDLAVANGYSDNVSILRNNGDGTFQAAVNYSAASYPRCVFCADVNGDTYPDLVVANELSNSVSILLNNGDATLRPNVDCGTGQLPVSVFCGDLDADSDLDLAVVNSYGDNLSILKNNGDGTFLPRADYGTGSYPISVFCTDLDGNGSLDLAVANESSNNVSILRNNGDGTFRAKVDYGIGQQPFYVNGGDLDADGDYDLAAVNSASNNVSVLINQSVGQAQPVPTTLITSGPLEGEVLDTNAVRFAWIGSDDVTPVGSLLYSYKLDSAEWSPFSSDTSHTFTNLAEGYHTFMVRAMDGDLNVDSTPAVRHFSVQLPPPVLNWTGSYGYIADGVEPDAGIPSTEFLFKVKYSDAKGTPPWAGYPKVQVDVNGDGDINDPGDGEYAMQSAVAGEDFVTGLEYYITVLLPAAPTIHYRFVAVDTTYDTATGAPTQWSQGPMVYQEQTDLYVYSDDIVFSVPHPDTAESFQTWVTIHNNSSMPVSAIKLVYFDHDTPIDTAVVPYIGAWSETTIGRYWQFNTMGFYPIKVVVDPLNEIQEWNESNNFAIRGITIGNYQLPGLIAMSANTPLSVCPGITSYVSGSVWYFVPPSYSLGELSGGSVILTVLETGWSDSSYTNDLGYFSVPISTPSDLGIYHVQVEVTDYTLTKDTTLQFTVSTCYVPSDPGESGSGGPGGSTCADLRATMSYTNQLLVAITNDTTTYSASVYNVGSDTAVSFTSMIISDGQIIDSLVVEQLVPGEYAVIPVGQLSYPTPGWHCLTVAADYYNAVHECNEANNNAGTCFRVWTNCPDLAPEHVALSNPSPFPNQMITITTDLANTGGAEADNVWLNFYDDDSLFASVSVGHLIAFGGRAYPTVSYTFADTGTHRIDIVVDPNNLINECDEGNNTYSVNFHVRAAKPDVWTASQYIMPQDINPDPGENDSIYVTIWNAGETSAHNVSVLFQVDGEQLGDTVVIDTIPIGSDNYRTVVSTEPWLATDQPQQIHIIRVVSDVRNAITEISESNNEATRSIICGAAPNLYVNENSILFSQINASPGTHVLVTVWVYNNGGLSADGVVRLSHVLPGADTVAVGSAPVHVDSLGGSSPVAFWWTVPGDSVTVIADVSEIVPDDFDPFDNLIGRFYAPSCGDANADGMVDISDAVYLISYIFSGGSAPDPLDAGDANCDSIVDISDAVYLIAYIFSGGSAPCAWCK